MDTFSEQLVTRSATKSDMIKKILISVAGILIASILMWLSIVFSFYSLILLVFGVLGGAVWLVSNMDVEYEYIITNNEMDIDKIIGRRKRKRMITLDLKSAEDFGKYPSKENIAVDATVHATTGLEKNAHYLLVNHGSYGKVMLIFNPNEKTREAIMQEVSNPLRVKIINDAK